MKRNYRFENWSKTFGCFAHGFVQPNSEMEIKECLRYALDQGLSVRILGSGHSPSDISCVSGGILINLDNLNRILHIDGNLVCVEAGIKLCELNERLDEACLAIPNLGSISEQSIAGAISTGTHGTGIHYGPLHSQIHDLRIMLYTGEVMYASNTENSDLFKAALCSLGTLGVLLTVTLKVEPRFYLESHTEVKQFEDVLSNWASIVSSAEHVRFMWFPHTEHVVIWRANRRLAEDQNDNQNKVATIKGRGGWVKEKLFGYYILEMLLFVSKLCPSIIPLVNDTYAQYLYNPASTVVDKSWRVFNIDCLFRQYVTEWAVEWKQVAPKVLRELKHSIDANPRIKAHFPIEIRFVKGDDAWLSPGYGMEGICYIGIIAYRPFGVDVQDKQEYWSLFEDLMINNGGRPHWAKDHPLKANQLAEIYPKFDDFCRLRAKCDPYGLFVNPYVKRHFINKSSKL